MFFPPNANGTPNQIIGLRTLFAQPNLFTTAPSPVYGEDTVQIRWLCQDLL
jgi:hypothetical protein